MLSHFLINQHHEEFNTFCFTEFNPNLPNPNLLGSSMDLRFLDAPSKPPALEAYAAQTWKDLWVKGSRPGCQGGGDGTGKSEALEMRS